MIDESGDELWSTALKQRAQLYRSQIHTRSDHRVLRERIGKTLSALNDLTMELKSCMNAVSVARLPPEVLVLIFHFLSYDLPLIPATADDLFYDYKESHSREVEVEGSENSNASEDSKSVNDIGPSSTWLKATHVCSYWREVALRDAYLWSQLSTDRSWTWTDAFLARSRPNGKLTVHLGTDMIPNTMAMRGLIWAEAISRTHTLHITDIFEHWRRYLSTGVGYPRSLVKLSVNLTIPPPPERDEEAIGKTYCSPQPIGTTEIIGGLRELSLCGFLNYSWPPPFLCPTLTSLKLGAMVDEWVYFDTSLQAVLDTLAQLQSLQSLTLLGLCSFDSENRFKTYRDTVHLPRLELLHIEKCHVEAVLAILNAVVTPASDAKMCLVPFEYEWEYNDSNTAASLDILKHRLSGPSWSNLQAVALLPAYISSKFLQLARPDDVGCVVVSAWRSEVDALSSVQEGRDISRPDIYLRLPWNEDDEDHNDYPHKLLRLFDHVPIRTLCLLEDHNTFNYSSTPRSMWVELRHHAALQHLVVRGRVSTSVIRYMYMECDGELDNEAEEWLSQSSAEHLDWRRLTFLNEADHLVGWAKKARMEDPYGPSSYTSSKTWAQLLEQVYQARTNEGLATEIFVDRNDLANGAFDSMSDKSILQAVDNRWRFT